MSTKRMLTEKELAHVLAQTIIRFVNVHQRDEKTLPMWKAVRAIGASFGIDNNEIETALIYEEKEHEVTKLKKSIEDAGAEITRIEGEYAERLRERKMNGVS